MKRTLSVVTVLVAAWAMSACEDTQDVKGPSEMRCTQARRDYTSAVENYSILEARTPRSEVELIPQYLRAASDLMDVDANGNVVPQPGGGCG